MPAPPLKTAISGTPSRATANTGFGALYDYVVGLLGATGNVAEAQAILVPNDSVTFTKIQNIASGTLLGRSTGGAGDVEGLTGAQATALLVPASETVSGRVELADSTEAAAGTDTTRALSPARLRSAVNATGTAPIYACRAWVNFNGTGTVAIRASGNVSSITDNGTGDYTVNFTTAMPDADYCGVASGSNGGAAQFGWTHSLDTFTTTSCRKTSSDNNVDAAVDTSTTSVAIFR